MGNCAVKTWCAAGLFAVLALVGCHAPTRSPMRAPPAVSQLPVTTRVRVVPDVSAISTDAPAFAARPGEYRKLTAADCRKFAAANAPFADDLDRHPDNDPPAHAEHRLKAARNAETSRLVRGHAADELRNRAAGDALDEFFKLINAEGQYDLLAAADEQVRAQLEDALKAERAGLKDRADIPSIRRKLLDLEAQRAKLEAAIGALNASLRARLNLAANDPLPLWPADPLKVKPDDVDVEQAVVSGAHYRSDLNLLRVLADGTAGDMTESVMRTINPLLALSKTGNPLVAIVAPILAPFTGKPQQTRAETTARVAAVLHAREKQAEAEIRAAAVMLRGQRAAVAARALDVKHVEAQIAELQKRQKAGLNVTAELAVANIDLLKAKGDLLTAVTDWHATEVKLRQAMGLLVRE